MLSAATVLAALAGVLLTTLLAWLVLSAAALLAALSGVLLTTLLARLLLAATMLAAALALLARLMFTRVHNGSFVGPPITTKPCPLRFPAAWKASVDVRTGT